MELLKLKQELDSIIRNSQDLLDSLNSFDDNTYDPYRAILDFVVLHNACKNIADNKQAIELTIENEQIDYQERIKLARFYEDDKALSLKSLM